MQIEIIMSNNGSLVETIKGRGVANGVHGTHFLIKSRDLYIYLYFKAAKMTKQVGIKQMQVVDNIH